MSACPGTSPEPLPASPALRLAASQASYRGCCRIPGLDPRRVDPGRALAAALVTGGIIAVGVILMLIAQFVLLVAVLPDPAEARERA